jgi:hypothetical protein
MGMCCYPYYVANEKVSIGSLWLWDSSALSSAFISAKPQETLIVQRVLLLVD